MWAAQDWIMGRRTDCLDEETESLGLPMLSANHHQRLYECRDAKQLSAASVSPPRGKAKPHQPLYTLREPVLLEKTLFAWPSPLSYLARNVFRLERQEVVIPDASSSSQG